MPSIHRNIIYLYAGPGASASYFGHFTSTLKKCIHPSYCIEPILAHQVKSSDWQDKAALFVMPGGADVPYMKALNGTGNAKIISYVENGGAFLGICAGSYYAGAFVDFAKETALEVRGARELSFFPGIVKGPHLASYDYHSMKGALAASIHWTDLFQPHCSAQCTLFYNGGGYFVDAYKTERTKVLATYSPLNASHTDDHAAIIECSVGHGTALLSAVHFEYDPFYKPIKTPLQESIRERLQQTNAERIQNVKQLLKRLHIQCIDD